jgi:hypothetical protein
MRRDPTQRCWRRLPQWAVVATDGPHRKYCAQPRAAHDPVTGHCPNGYGSTYQAHVHSPKRAATSHSEPEARVLYAIATKLLSGALRGDDAAAFARLHARELGLLARKAGLMLERIEQQKAVWVPRKRGGGIRKPVMRVGEAAE